MLIETPEAAPVTTTWNDSNSFLAAAIFAVGAAPCGACTVGRIFWAAGATHTCAAETEPAAVVNSAASVRLRNFMMPPWLAADRNGGGSPFRLTNSGG